LLHGGAEVKSYAAAGQAALLLVVVKLYSRLAHRVGRLKLLAKVYLFSAANLLMFAALARAGAVIGVPFYLWVGGCSRRWALAARPAPSLARALRGRWLRSGPLP
jgi:hypothetical protein